MNFATDLSIPANWALETVNAGSHQLAWERFSGCLKSLGFENSCFIRDAPRFSRALPPADQIYGHMVADAWMAHVHGLEPERSSYKVAEAASIGLSVEVIPARELESVASSKEGIEAMATMIDFGLQGGWTFPVINRSSATYSVLMLDCHSDLHDQQALIMQHATYLRTSTVYFQEGLAVLSLLESSPAPLLSPREAECLTWTGVGKTTKEIASLLGIAPCTVNECIARVTHKLGAANRTQAVARAMLVGLITRSV